MKSFEHLESRRLMDATTPYVINGTPGPDTINVSYEPPIMLQQQVLARAISRVRGPNVMSEMAYITINGVRKTAKIPQTQAIVINGLDGNDLIEVSGNHAVEIHAGKGDDRIASGPKNDVIFGDEGHDIINAGLGDDVVHGGADGDEIHGNGGDDLLFADGGGGLVTGDAGDDRLFGGDGPDNFHGGDGADTFM